jgi:hypothetical protein
MWQVRTHIALNAAHAHVLRSTQSIAQPLLFADVHVYPYEFASLLKHFLMHDSRGSSPGFHTKRLHVHEDYDDYSDDDDVLEELSALMALLPFMPNLRFFSWRDYLIKPPVITTLGEHGQHTLQTLEIQFDMSDAPGVLTAVGHFSALRTLRIELLLEQDEHTVMLDASAPLVLTSLARFEAVLSSDVYLFPHLARWLARCELPVLDHLALVSNEYWPVESESGMFADFVPFFAAHQDLRVLSVDACEKFTVALLALDLPPGLRRITLRSPTALPRSLPTLPPGLQQLAVCGDPALASLWALLAHLLREPSLPLTEIIVVLEVGTDPEPEYPEGVRSFSWREILLPPCRIDKLDDRHVHLCGNMVLYALRFRQRGISILDDYGCVWPGDGESGQWPGASFSCVHVVLTLDQQSTSHNCMRCDRRPDLVTLSLL